MPTSQTKLGAKKTRQYYNSGTGAPDRLGMPLSPYDKQCDLQHYHVDAFNNVTT